MFAVFKRSSSSHNPISPVYANFSTALEYKQFLPPKSQDHHVVKQMCGDAGWCDCEKRCVICNVKSHRLLCSLRCYEIYKEEGR